VHPTSACVDKAIARKAFGRALRIAAQLDTDPVQTWITKTDQRSLETHDEMAD
jgi:predicted RNA-binding protein YlxR (DUF448 family)